LWTEVTAEQLALAGLLKDDVTAWACGHGSGLFEDAFKTEMIDCSEGRSIDL
jgi:hypothetical protein